MNELNHHILKRYLEGNCSTEDLVYINSWIKESKDHARQLFLLEESYQIGKRNPFLEKQQTKLAEDKLFKRIETERATSQKRLRIHQLLKYAALVALVLTGGGFGYWGFQNSLSPNMLTASADQTVQQLILPDGTKVWLNQSTTLTYPSSFSDDIRSVHLEGEAYFEVAKNKAKPFIIESESMRIKVLGTIFNFKTRKELQITEASLIQGEIEVKGENEEGMIILAPGQKAELNKTTGRLLVKQVNTKIDAAWHDGLIPFDQASIVDIAQTLERFYNVKIIVSPDADLTKTYSGVLKQKESINEVLKSLTNSTPLRYKIVGDSIFISFH